ncbi:MAG: iron-containing redox enzyme family protein [Acidimicrobiia bacterium]|nr:iron-containing redox enzyme family protein [Acidimicrobiia bacterium]
MSLVSPDRELLPLGEPHRQTLPAPCGPRSEHLVARLRRRSHELGELPAADPGDDPLDGDDTALALHILYELHYSGFQEVDERWEWEPSLLAARRVLETELEGRLVDLVGPPPIGLDAAEVGAALDELATSGGGPSLSAWMADEGTLLHLREFAAHRSIYQLKEADPHTWGIPRLTGGPKAAMVEIQRGEYGDGDPAEVHSTLFAETMRHLGLDDRYGAYLDRVPGVTLTTGNLISLFGLHRRWRGALVGHLALFEMCSVAPMGRYRDAILRLGVDPRAAYFYEAHVVADAHHQVVGRDHMAVALARDEPLLGGEVVFGARALGAVERRFAEHLLGSWSRGASSLRRPLDIDLGDRSG